MADHVHNYVTGPWKDMGRYLLVTYRCTVKGCTSTYQRREPKGT